MQDAASLQALGYVCLLDSKNLWNIPVSRQVIWLMLSRRVSRYVTNVTA